MATITLRPDTVIGTRYATGHHSPDLTPVPITASLLADDLGATWVALGVVPFEVNVDAYIQMGLTDLDAAALEILDDAIIKSVAIRALLAVFYVSQHFNFSAPGISGTVIVQKVNTSMVVLGSSPGPVTVAQINTGNIRLGMTDHSGSPILHELYYDIVAVRRPVVTTTNPTGLFDSTNTPMVRWTNALDADGGAQTNYHIKLFTADQYDDPGFDPETSVAALDSGALNGNAASWRPTVGLLNDSYRAYVQVAQTVNSLSYWSDWSYSDFVIDATPPDAPTISAVPDQENARNVITVAASGPGTVTMMEIDFSTDGGHSWDSVRTGNSGFVDGGDETVVYDYEAPPVKQVIYRARSLRVGLEGTLASEWAQVTIMSWASTEWWLKHPGRPELNMRLTVRSFPSVERAGRVGIFQALGSKNAVGISDTRGPLTGTITLRLDSIGQQDALDALLDTADTLLLVAPPDEGGPGYIRVGDHSRARIADRASAVRTFDSLSFTVVASPIGNASA